ncbi:MAG: signal recognition particle receptor subunit alpha, partial [Pseudomonadota bacterium]
MFANLTDRLDETLQKIRGQGRLSDDNIRETVRDVRMALLEADVALPVVKAFTQQIREKAAGTEIMQSLSPGETLVKIVKDELTVLMGEQNESLNLSAQPPAVIMLAGLQGSGKTTSAAKLARFLLGSGKK